MPLRPAGARLCLVALTLTVLAAPLQAEVIHRGLGPEPDSLHIHQAQGLAAVNLLRDIREGLVTFDASGNPAPGQASSWEVLDGGLRYRFSLRPDARWSDGSRVTAADFVRAWQRAVAPATAASTAGLLRVLRGAPGILEGRADPATLGVRAIDESTLEVELETAAPWLPEILAHPVAYPLHPANLEDLREAPVNGAFRIAGWEPRALIRLVRNEQFHAADSVRVEGVDYYPIEEPATELARYRARELQITETIPAGRYAWLRENMPGELRVFPYLGSFWLGINLRHPALGRSAELRRALALAIDREILVGTVLGAGDLPGWSVVPPGIPGYEPARMPESAMSQPEREAEARRLYRIAGYGEDEPLRLELRYNTSNIHRRVAVAVGAMWKQVLGVHAELVNEEWKVFVNNRRMGVVTEVFRGGWIADYADPASFLELFLGGDSLSGTQYAEPAFDARMEAAAEAGPGRMQALREAEARLMQDMPVIPLYYYVSRHLVHPGVSGYEDNVRDIHLSRYLDLENE